MSSGAGPGSDPAATGLAVLDRLSGLTGIGTPVADLDGAGGALVKIPATLPDGAAVRRGA